MSGKIIKTTEEELKRIVAEAIADKFRDIGIMAHNDDFVEKRRRDFEFLHDLRSSTESAKSRVGAAFLVLATGGVLAMLVSGFKIWTRQP